MHTLTRLCTSDPEAASERILGAIAQARGNRSEAARLLELPYRALYRLIVRLLLHDAIAKLASTFDYNPGHPGVAARGLDPGNPKPRTTGRPRGRPRKALAQKETTGRSKKRVDGKSKRIRTPLPKRTDWRQEQ